MDGNSLERGYEAHVPDSSDSDSSVRPAAEAAEGAATGDHHPAADLQRRQEEMDDQRKKHLARLADFMAASSEETIPSDAVAQLSLGMLMYIEADIAHAMRLHQLQHGLSLNTVQEMLPTIEAMTKLAREKEKLAKFNARHESVPPLWNRRGPG